jgi:hypothetical protein
MLIFGLVLLWRGQASLFGVEQIAGRQAMLVGIACIIYATVLLFVFFRRRR